MLHVGLKSYLIAALGYLTLAAIAAVASHYSSIGAIGVFARTHFHLLGFVAMAIYGLGYWIAPRFGRRPLRFPRWVPVHFWLGNISLIAMVIAQICRTVIGGAVWDGLFYLSVGTQVLLMVIFVLNLWLTLVSAKNK